MIRSVHVISRKALRLFWERHPDSKEALLRWIKIVRRTRFRNSLELRDVFPSADPVGDWVVFNIHGDKYRLVTSIHFNRGEVYVRHVLTRAECSRGSWKR